MDRGKIVDGQELCELWDAGDSNGTGARWLARIEEAGRIEPPLGLLTRIQAERSELRHHSGWRLALATVPLSLAFILVALSLRTPPQVREPEGMVIASVVEDWVAGDTEILDNDLRLLEEL